MNKKGFTLVELLAVVVILAVVALITVPLVNRFILNTRDTSYEMAEKSLETSARNLMAECAGYVYGDEDLKFCEKFSMPSGTSTTTISLKDLIDNGYLDPIEDPGKKGDYCDPTKSYVVVSASGDGLNVDFSYEKNLYCNSRNYVEEGVSENVDENFVVLVSATVNDTNYDYGTWVRQPVTVHLSTTYTGGTLQKYQYKLDTESDSEWHDILTDSFTINYSTDGNYQFRGVSTSGKTSANSNESRSIRVDVTPPEQAEIQLVGDKNGTDESTLFKSNVIAMCGRVGDNFSGIKECGVSLTKNGVYQNRISFENEGLSYTVYMRVVDNLGNVLEKEKTFGIDKVKPSLSSVTLRTADGNTYSGGWTNQSVKLLGNASDNLMISSVVYKLGSAAEVRLGVGEFYEITNTTNTTLTVYAEDKAKNKSPVSTVTIKIDKTKPVIDTIEGLAAAVGTSQTINIVAHDDGGSNLAATAYSFDNGVTWQAASSKTFTSNGEIKVKVRDAAGNISNLKTETLGNIDVDGPVINSITGYSNTNWAKSATLKIDAKDNGVGLHASAYSWDNGSTWKASNQATFTSNKTVRIKVRDQLGNITSQNVTLSKLDSIAPTAEVTGNTTGVTASKTLTINASDDLSGLHDNPYSWDNGSTWEKTKSKTFTSNQIVNVKVRDALGNTTSTIATKIESVDTTGPSVDVQNMPTTLVKEATLKIVASDSGSGLPTNAYSWDGGANYGSATTKKFTSSGKITVAVKDNAGNVTKKEVTVVNIDSQVPKINSVTGNSTSNYVASVTLTVNAEDQGVAGLHATAYSFDNGSNWQASASKKFTSNTTVYIKVRDKLGNEASTSVVISKIDSTKPTCSVEKTATGKDGVSVKITCADTGGSGVNTCNGSTSNPTTKTGIKANTEFEVKDKAGNSGKCSVSISTSTEYYNCTYQCYERYNYTYTYDHPGYNCRSVNGNQSACCTLLNCSIHFSNGNCACKSGYFTCPSDWPDASVVSCSERTLYS